MAKPTPDWSRRQFIRNAALGAGGLALAGHPLLAQAAKTTPGLPAPGNSGIDHIVVLMMENRSFDHIAGWVPGADGRQAGLTYQDTSGQSFATHRLAPDYQGCGHPDPDHSYDGGRVEFDNGSCDGWLRAGMNDDYAIGYYTAADLPFFAGAVQDWTICDRYFSGIMASTYPNRFYMHAAQTDRLSNSSQLSTLPTIWDSLAAANIDARYYFSDLPFLAFWGPKYIPISRPFQAFLSDCQAGTLPPVSMIDPRFLGEAQGIANDDHPHADIRNGQAFMNQVYSAVVNSPRFRETMLVITYDEWGGFFDHVPPPTAPIPAADAAAGNQDGRLGFRVPTIVVSPYAPRRAVSHAVLDPTSVLNMIEWRFNLPPLTVRDATATNLATILDFKNAHPRRPLYDVPQAQIPTPCGSTDPEWAVLESIARVWGWLP
jgi:phospholipase C